jgi:RecA/RadA recombinase
MTEARANMIDYISTGSYAMNRMLSGSYFKGIPSNRLICFHGPSQSGKSVLAGCCAREAQKKGYQVIYYDSENALDKEFCDRLGIKYDEVILRYPETISEFRNMAANDMQKWRDKYGEEAKLFLVCDSIGNLMGTKEKNDIEAGKDAADMGQRAKELRSCARALTMRCGRCNVPMVVVNHSYDQNTTNPMAAPTRKMSGGEGFVYACTCIVELRKSQINEDEKNAAGDKVRVTKGVILKAKTQKNRIVQEGLRAEVLLSFSKGISRFYGLLEDALEHEFFEKKSTRVQVHHLDKSFFEKQLYAKQNTKDVWEPILKDLNVKVEKTIGYASKIEGEDELLKELEEDASETSQEELESE